MKKRIVEPNPNTFSFGGRIIFASLNLKLSFAYLLMVHMPLVVTAACTGLRRGDVCRLPWKAVDLRAGTVNVRTAKTGAGAASAGVAMILNASGTVCPPQG